MTHPNASRERGPVLGIILAAVLVTMATSADVASGAIAVSNLANFHNGNFGRVEMSGKSAETSSAFV